MGFRNWNLEWLNHNAQRAYPLAADATAADGTAAFQLPTDFIVGLYLPIHSGLNVQPGRFFVKTIGAYSSGYSIIIGYAADDGNIPVASALIAKAGFTPNQSYSLGGIGDFADTVGRIVIGSLDNIDQQPAGQFEFSLGGGRLETDVVRPIVRGVSSIQVQNGTNLSDKLYGIIVLNAGRNVKIDSEPNEDGTGGEVTVNAIEGEGLTTPCDCADQASATPIYTINGVGPNAEGDFTLLDDDCLKLAEITHGLQLQDECSKPCCGCKELKVVVDTAHRIETTTNTLENFMAKLEREIAVMSAVLGTTL